MILSHKKTCLLVYVLLSLLSHTNSQNTTTCNSHDLNSLKPFLNQINNTPGILCHPISGRVISLTLSNHLLTGQIPESISNLTHLQTLNLSRNYLNGPIPNSIFMLKNLEILDLSSNEFDGEMGGKIFDLPLLRVLDISDNKISGGVPGGICLNSTRLRVVKLAVNNLTAGLPHELKECRSLEHLCLASNKITGVVSAFLLELPSLKVLDLQDNLLNETELNENGLVSGVTRLDFSLNRFSGSLPDFFDKFPNLMSFCARSNGFTGGMPKSLVNSRAISVINLRNNSLSGGLRFNCSVMVNLTSVDLGSNNFSGFIPSDLSSCRKLRAINLARNKFIGEIPESFKEFKSLSYLSLSNCSFTNLESTLKILQHVPNLTVLVLTMNFRGEMLPVDSTLHFKGLKALVIANCGLTGNIPLWLNGLTKLQLLDLSWNRLTGSVPSYLGDFKSLFYLDLSNNSLSGEIPKSLTQLPSLSFRNVSLEEGSPDFPFFKRPNMSSRGSALQYNQIMSFPPLIDLSHNFINGSIWREFGNLKRLHVLNLKHNNLSGGIPSELSGMTSIETLDLSHNNLSGRIPRELVRLSFLSLFSVAYNDLSGTIPNGGQFATFANSSFEGNKELCGSGCGDLSDRIVPEPSSSGSKKSKVTVVGMAVGIGIGSVFILALMFVIILRATMKQEVDPEREDDNDSKEELEPKLVILFQTKEELSLDDLLKSTNSFDQANIIGCGGFGLVFKATLPDGKNVAIKRLSGDTGQVDREFQAEVETLSRAQHPNLVLLQGYCQYKNDRFLIYSYMENGSLDYWLHEKSDGPSKLKWDTRLRIGQGAIKGLAYLHQSCDPHILHRDIKSSNIYEELNAVLDDKSYDIWIREFAVWEPDILKISYMASESENGCIDQSVGDRGNDAIQDNEDVNPSTKVSLESNQNTCVPEVVEELSSLGSAKEDRSTHHNFQQDKCRVGPVKATAFENVKAPSESPTKHDQSINESTGSGKQNQVTIQIGDHLFSSMVTPSTPPTTDLNPTEESVSESVSTRIDYVSPLITKELDLEICWNYKDPSGKVQGPFSLAQLHKWKDQFPSDIKIWKIYGSVKDTILLNSALKRRSKYVG